MFKRKKIILLFVFYISILMMCSGNKEAANLNKLGFQYYTQGETGKAIENLKKAVQMDPKLKIAHYNLGVVYSQLDSLDKAIEEWQKVLEYDNKNSLAMLKIGIAYFKKGDVKQGSEYVKRAQSINKDFKNIVDIDELIKTHGGTQ